MLGILIGLAIDLAREGVRRYEHVVAERERLRERDRLARVVHDGVLQTLALIQLHAGDQQTVFSLARQQERELREWLYQERTTSDRSVNAGLKQIAAHVEDTHGKPIEVVTVGDARPSAQTVLKVRFDAAGNVLGVERSGLEQIASIDPDGDKTPTLGRTRGFFQELFGNIGAVRAPVPGGGAPGQ